MKRYIVKNKATQEVFGEFDSKEEAGMSLLFFLNSLFGKPECPSLFDFDIEEQEERWAPHYENAKKYLGVSDESSLTIYGTSEHHEKALTALSILFTIADAWNKEDNFVPDFSKEDQNKYYPFFEYDNENGRFVYAGVGWTQKLSRTCLGVRICFVSYSRAFRFGKEFEGLFNNVLLTN